MNGDFVLQQRLLALRFVMAVLLLEDGLLHLSLEWVFPGDLQQLGSGGYATQYLLYFLAALCLSAALWRGPALLRRWAWVLDLLVAGLALASIVVFLFSHHPNPLGLATISKTSEILLLLAAGADLWLRLSHSRRSADAGSSEALDAS